MNIIEIIISSIALASDAFAVSISKGLSLKNNKIKNCFIIALWFGIFQGIMPAIGYIFGTHFEKSIINIDHYIAFSLLIYIGGKMIYETYNNKETINNSIKFKEMLILSIATSIDALSFGLAYSFGYKQKNVILCFSLITLITFLISFIGVKIGNKLGKKFEKISKIIGGIILIILGINVLIDHLL